MVREASRTVDDHGTSQLVEAPLVLLLVDARGAITLAEGGGLSRLGLEPGAPAGRSVDEVLSDRPAILDGLRHALAGEPSTKAISLDGASFDVRFDPHHGRDGDVDGARMLALEVDVATGRTVADERLERSEARLAEAQRVAHVGSWEWDVDRNTVVWSDEMYRIYGFTRAEFTGTYESFMERVHPDDREHTKSVVLGALRSMEPFAYNHRIVRADGLVRMLHTRGKRVAGAQGGALRLIGTCWDVTESWEAERELAQSVSLLRATLESTADGLLVVDRSGVFVTYNQRFLAMWRIPANLADRHDDDAVLALVIDQLEDPDGFIGRVRAIYAQPEAETFDTLWFKDGRVFERYSQPQRLGAEVVGRVWSFRDVTERERLLRRALFLADASRLLASLEVETALDAVANLAVPSIGEACAIDLFADEGGPRRLVSVARDPTKPISAELPPAIFGGHSVLQSVGPLSYMAVPLVAHGKLLGAFTFTAAAHRRYAPADLALAEDLGRRASLAIENARLYRRANDALQAREEFLSVAAHEIRGPITSLHLAAQALQRGGLNAPTSARMLDLIAREDRRLTRFVDELLDVARIRSGQLHFDFEEVDLAEVTRAAAVRLGPDVSRSGSSLSIMTEGRIVGYWDRFRADQIVTNLLANAIKFGQGRPIEIVVSASDGRAKLVVTDHGIGIPPDRQQAIFEPFERAVSTRHYGGLGLGLYIVRTIVTGLGGTVRVDSQPGAGATFTVELPESREP